MDYLLSTTNLTKQFGKNKAVNSVCLHVRQGDIYGLIGRNGAGKTTFLKMAGGLSAPTEGEITLFGEGIRTLRISIKKALPCRKMPAHRHIRLCQGHPLSYY